MPVLYVPEEAEAGRAAFSGAAVAVKIAAALTTNAIRATVPTAWAVLFGAAARIGGIRAVAARAADFVAGTVIAVAVAALPADTIGTTEIVAKAILVERALGFGLGFALLLFLPFLLSLLGESVVSVPQTVSKQPKRRDGPEGRAAGGGGVDEAGEGIEATSVHGYAFRVRCLFSCRSMPGFAAVYHALVSRTMHFR
jgi:hypothetical protein